MTGSRFSVDLDTIRRFDRPGPRYTSYPTAVEFHDGVGAPKYMEHPESFNAVLAEQYPQFEPTSRKRKSALIYANCLLVAKNYEYSISCLVAT